MHLLCLGHSLLPHDRLALCECCLPLAEGGISGQEGDTAVGDNDGSSRLDVGGTHRRGKDHNIRGAYTDVYTHYIRTYVCTYVHTLQISFYITCVYWYFVTV